jgi:hypothetical protein
LASAAARRGGARRGLLQRQGAGDEHRREEHRLFLSSQIPFSRSRLRAFNGVSPSGF